MPPHVHEAASTALFGVLAPGFRNGRIPARQLGAAQHGNAKMTFPEESECGLMLRMEAHHEPRAQLYPVIGADFHRPTTFLHRKG